MGFILKNWGILLTVLLSIPTILPLFIPGFFQVHDDTQVARVFEMQNSLRMGIFPVRWTENLGYGFGYAIFNFYAPLSYYIGASFTFLGANALLATKIMFGLGTVLSGILMYFFLRNFFNSTSALSGAILYLYFPYHAVNIYVRGAVSEFFAYAFLPLFFLALFKLFKNFESNVQRFQWHLISLGSFSLFLIVLSHNLTALMVSLFFAVFVIISTPFVKKKIFYLSHLSGIFILGLLISSFYVLPAVLEQGFVDVNSIINEGARYSDHFVCFSQLWESAWGFGGSAPGCLDGMSFRLGKLNILFLLFSIGVFLFAKTKGKVKHTKLFVFSLVLFALSIFLTLPYSKIFWDSIPVLEFLQFPWRFLNFSGVFLSFLVAYFFFLLQKINFRASIFLSLIFIALTLFINTKLFMPQEILQRDSSFYEREEYLKFDVSKISDEYLPQNFEVPKDLSEVPKSLVGETGGVEIEERSEGLISVFLKNENKDEVKLNLAYFPFMEFEVNGEKITPTPTNNGILLELPRGEHHITVRYKQTPVENIGNSLSLLGIAIFLFTLKKTHEKH